MISAEVARQNSQRNQPYRKVLETIEEHITRATERGEFKHTQPINLQADQAKIVIETLMDNGYRVEKVGEFTLNIFW